MWHSVARCRAGIFSVSSSRACTAPLWSQIHFRWRTSRSLTGPYTYRGPAAALPDVYSHSSMCNYLNYILICVRCLASNKALKWREKQVYALTWHHKTLNCNQCIMLLVSEAGKACWLSLVAAPFLVSVTSEYRLPLNTFKREDLLSKCYTVTQRRVFGCSQGLSPTKFIEQKRCNFNFQKLSRKQHI